MAALDSVGTEDDPEFVSRAARVIGMANGYWPDTWKTDHLARLLEVDEAACPVATELGFASLGTGLEALDEDEALAALRRSNEWFHQAAAADAESDEAALWAAATDALIMYSAGGDPATSAEDTRRRLRALVAARSGTGASEPVRRRRSAEIEWAALAAQLPATGGLRLTALGNFLDRIVGAYAASRTLMVGASATSAAILSRIERSWAQHRILLDALTEWADDPHLDPELRAAADDLLNRAGGTSPGKPDATGGLPAVASALRVPLDAVTSLPAQLADMLKSGLATHRHQPGPVKEVFDRITEQLSAAEDFTGETKLLVEDVLRVSLRYMHDRANRTPASLGGQVGWLFDWGKGDAPHESKLAEDYAQYLNGSDIAGYVNAEVNEVGGGRVDVIITGPTARIVVEVKRSSTLVTEEHAPQWYGQEGAYQTTDVTIGFVLVLDLSPKTTHPRHLRRCAWTSTSRAGEHDDWRHIVTLVVEGRRTVPSSTGGPPDVVAAPPPGPPPPLATA
jgi:hypothetical protein